MTKLMLSDNLIYQCIHCGHIRSTREYRCSDSEGHHYHVKKDKKRKYTRRIIKCDATNT